MSTISTFLPKTPNNFSTQVSSATVASTAISFTVNDASGLPSEGVGQLFKKDVDGEVVVGSVEFIHWTGVSGNTISLTDTDDRGLEGSDAGAQTYVNGDYFEVWVSSYYQVDPNEIVTPDGTQTLTNKTLTSPTIGGTPVLDSTSAIPFYNDSMSRQAIMNGNFDVWQRGTSVALTDVTVIFQADRWNDYVARDGGTLPTLTRSRQLLASGDISNAFYYSRLTTNGAGTSLGVNSLHRYAQNIENGTRLLCGLNKKVTVSFWARSSIANKRIVPNIYQQYGTGGSPSTAELILGTPITLTSTWTKYTATFTTNTLVGKTFGTDNNDFIQFNIYTMWGTTIGNTNVQNGITAETFVGAGTIDIAQVQLCAGDVALPFQPKSYEEELRACQRYALALDANTSSGTFGFGSASATTSAAIVFPLSPNMRTTPTLESATAGDWRLSDGVGSATCTGMAVSSTASCRQAVVLVGTVASGLTQYRPYRLSAGEADKKIVITAEL